MPIGRFIAGIAALIWSPGDSKYLLLKRSLEKDFGSGAWECVTGRVDQGESFEEALQREVEEELGVEVQVEFILGTTHFYRGANLPENELLGVAYFCSIDDQQTIRMSAEHTEHLWVTAEEVENLLGGEQGESNRWIREAIARAERLRRMMPAELMADIRQMGTSLV